MSRNVAVALILTLAALLLFLSSDYSVYDYNSSSEVTAVSYRSRDVRRSSNESEPVTNLIFDTCKLWIHDPEYGDIKKVLQPKKNPIANCNKSFKSMTVLKDGILTIHPEASGKADKCVGRCLHYETEKKNRFGDWLEIANTTFECDFVEAKCSSQGKPVEVFIHTQIWEGKKNATIDNSNKTEEKPFRPDVYIIVIDSVASTQARRSLPKTLEFMTKNMSGTFFHYLNKVGDNSPPNAYAMTLGWRIVDSDRSRTGGTPLKATHSTQVVCDQIRDNDPLIFKEYMKEGYKALYLEDWYDNLFAWPKCKGFVQQPTTHYYRPFVLEWEQYAVKAHMSESNCFERYSMMVDHTEKFVNSYKDDPKFALYWTARLSHDDPNLLYHTDSYFEGFFKRNEEKFRNSFVFFMADHGARLGSTRKTQLGDYEVHNPFLMLTVPERLRKNEEIMKNLKTNSEKLLTQFDVHATLTDILKFAPKTKFQSWPHIPIIEPNINNATSFLRPLGKFAERNCNNIAVDSSFCLCQFESKQVKNDEAQEMFGHYFVDHINSMFEQNNVTDKCEQLSLKELFFWVSKMTGVDPVKETNIYQVEFEVKPSGGTFKATAKYNSQKNIFIREGKLERTNEYKNQGDCMQHIPTLKPFCYCKKNG